ncbi:MAG: glycosyltransferase [Actinomycetota bacterium]|nr:glycosyltransferase [Actinomycetota bacterium]
MTDGRVVEVTGDQPRPISDEYDPTVEVSLVIPTYDEADNIADLLRRLNHVLAASGIGFELIVVDDDSPDSTWRVAANLTDEIPGLVVLRRKEAIGLATAVIDGWSYARGRLLGAIDGDGQHPPEVVTELLASIRDGADVAVASRHLDQGGMVGWSAARRLFSRGAQTLGQLLLPGTVGRVTDPMSGYFLVRRDVVAATQLDPVGYKILLEVLARCEVRALVESPYVFLQRTAGRSKVAVGHFIGYLRHLLRLRIYPLRSRALLRYLIVTAIALVIDAGVFVALFDVGGWNLTRSAAIAGEAGILFTVLLHDLWTFAGRPARTSLDRIRRLVGIHIALGVLLFGRLAVTNALVNWFSVGPIAAFLVALVVVMPGGHLLGSRLSWRSGRG